MNMMGQGFGPVGNPIPAGSIRPQAQQQIDPEAMKQLMYEQMVADAQKYAGSDPNAMICPTCGGSGVKTGKQPK